MSLKASMRRDKSAKRFAVWDDIVYAADGTRRNDDCVIVYAASATGVATFWVLAFIAVCVVKAADPATCFFPSSSRRRNLYTPEKREVRFSATYRQPKYYNPSPRGLSRVLRAIARISVNFRHRSLPECKKRTEIAATRRVSGIVRIIDRDFAIIFDVDKKIFKYRAIRLDIYFAICYNNTCNETASRFRREIWRYCTAG